MLLFTDMIMRKSNSNKTTFFFQEQKRVCCTLIFWDLLALFGDRIFFLILRTKPIFVFLPNREPKPQTKGYCLKWPANTQVVNRTWSKDKARLFQTLNDLKQKHHSTVFIQISSMAWASPIQILHKTVFDSLLPRDMMELAIRWKQISPAQNNSLLFVTLFSLIVCWSRHQDYSCL